MAEELPIIQKTYDFIKWYVPILDRLPRNHKFSQISFRSRPQTFDFLKKSNV